MKDYFLLAVPKFCPTVGVGVCVLFSNCWDCPWWLLDSPEDAWYDWIIPTAPAIHLKLQDCIILEPSFEKVLAIFSLLPKLQYAANTLSIRLGLLKSWGDVLRD